MTILSVQIYSLRDAGDLDTQLALARAAGFEWIESVAGHGLAPEVFAERLRAHGLRLSSMHVSLMLAESDPACPGCRWASARPRPPAGGRSVRAWPSSVTA
jgi:sugar phosphate isomerase/epimerase